MNLFLRIPSTTANLGPGFDLFGMALNLYNYIYVEFSTEYNFEIYSLDNQRLPFSRLSENLIYLSYKNVLQYYDYSEPLPAWKVTIRTEVSSGKGFGSSATAIVAGVQIAKKILEKDKNIQISLEKEIRFFLDMENHPDNVVPARIGGWVFCYDDRHVIKKILPDELGLCAIIPDFQISTESSRQQLKEYYKREDALSNMRGCLLWMEYIHSKNPDYLRFALQSDRLHEPIRYQGIPYYQEIRDFIRSIGCYGISLSGSGPGMIVYYNRNKEDFFRKKLIEFNALLNQKKKQQYIMKFCLPDYDGLVVYPEFTNFQNFIMEEKKTIINL